MDFFVQFLLGWLYGHFFEYAAHRWVFHNKKLKSAFNFHFSQHHAKSKRGCMVDTEALKKISFKEFETKSLIFVLVLHSPFVFYFPWFYFALVYSAVAYKLVHRKAHSDHDWARKHVPWHYDHHMGPDQHKNWAVRLPLFDYLLRSRVVYKGKPKEIIRYNNFKKWGRYGLRPRRTEHGRYRGNS